MFVGELLEMEKPDLEGIGEIAPGLELMRLLVGVDRDSLSDFDRVEVLRARARLRAHLDAELLADMSGILDAEIGRLGADLEWGDVHDVAASMVNDTAVVWSRITLTAEVRGADAKNEFTVFLAEIPDGFAGVEDVRVETGAIVVKERGTGKLIRVAH